jgi:endoglucanase
MVTTIEEDGFLGFCSVGGVDPRILMAQEVKVQTDSGELHGIIGAKPPHVLAPEDIKKAPMMKDLFIDIGFKADKVKELVKVGDMVTFVAPPIKLLNSRMASKTMDDRMGVVVMLEAAKYLQDKNFNASVVFCASVQEEVGCRGAKISAYKADPDMAIAIDVTHGKTPDARDDQAFDTDKVCLAIGPFIDREMLGTFKKAAEKCNVDIDIDVSGGSTGTDADSLQVVRDGVPVCVLQVPLKYMHTTVETLSYKTVKKTGKLLGQFILEVGGAK